MEVNKFSSLHVLVAGCGAIGKRHVDILVELGVGKISVCDPNKSYLNAVLEKYPFLSPVESYEKGLEQKPFAVFILTPTKMHIPMAIQALESGAHVFIEKPLSNSSDNIEQLKKVAEKCNRQVMVGFCMRYHEALIKAKQMVDNGTVGRVVSVRALVGEDFPAIHPEYKEMYISKYSGVFEIVHDVDLAIWMTGQQVESVMSVYGPFSDYEFESPDTVEMIIKLKEKAVATVHLDFFQNPRRRNIEVIGTNGTLIVEFSSWDYASISVFRKGDKEWQKLEFNTQRNDMFRAEDSEFLSLALENKPMKSDIDQASVSLLAIESVYKPY